MSYLVMVLKQDSLAFAQVACDEMTDNVIQTTTCTVPINQLKNPPFNLAWGASIQANIVAVNKYGQSLVSDAGNGAIILTIPDAPVNLANNPSSTTGSQIALSWAQGTSNGGTPVLDFTIVYKVLNAADFAVLAAAHN